MATAAQHDQPEGGEVTLGAAAVTATEPDQAEDAEVTPGAGALQSEDKSVDSFLCCGPGDVNVDVLNVHTPSGKLKLTVEQRKTLLTNLLLEGNAWTSN